jgi:hypothetical protein
MSALGELFANVGYKVDEGSIAKYDKALEESKKKTQGVVDVSGKLLDRMRDLEAARKKEQAQVAEFMKLAERYEEKTESDAEKKERLAKAMALISPAAKKTGEELSASEKQARSWTMTVVALEAGLNLAGRAFGFVRGKVSDMLGQLAQAGGQSGELVNLSKRTGISTDALQELGHAASQNGSDMQTLAAGWKTFANKADSAAKGGKDAAKTFREVGVSTQALKSGKLSLDEALGKVADKFAKMEDGPKKAALAMDLFGGAGGKLIPLLNVGGAEIGRFREEARKLGVVLSKEGLESLAGVDDQTNKLKSSLGALRTQALAAIAPAIGKVVAQLQAWLGENREKAVAVLTQAFSGLASMIKLAADGIGILVEAGDFLLENSDLVIEAIGGVTAALLAQKLMAIATSGVSVAAALASAKAWTAANYKFALIGLAVGLIIKYWPQISRAAIVAADAIRDAFGPVFDWIAEKTETLWKAAKWLIDKVNGADAFVNGRSNEAGTEASTGGTAAASSASRSISVPVSSAPSSSTTTNHVTTEIKVTGSAEPKATAVAVREEFQTMWNDKMRGSVA